MILANANELRSKTQGTRVWRSQQRLFGLSEALVVRTESREPEVGDREPETDDREHQKTAGDPKRITWITS